MKLISKVTEIYCIADDFCKEYELELNKKALSLSNPSPNTPKTRNRKGRMSDAEMITILVLFHSNTFRNFKHFYLFYVCRELKEEFPNLLSYTRFVERMPRVAIPLLLFLKLALMGECTGITFIDSTRIPPCVKTSVSILIVSSRAMLIKGKARWDGTMVLSCICCVMNEGNYSTLHLPKPMWTIVTRRYSIT